VFGVERVSRSLNVHSSVEGLPDIVTTECVPGSPSAGVPAVTQAEGEGILSATGGREDLIARAREQGRRVRRDVGILSPRPRLRDAGGLPRHAFRRRLTQNPVTKSQDLRRGAADYVTAGSRPFVPGSAPGFGRAIRQSMNIGASLGHPVVDVA
jgi:hypothetical protein